MSADGAAPARRGTFGKWVIRGLAAIGVLGCLGLIFLTASLIGLFHHRDQPAKVAAATTAEIFTIGEVTRVDGSTFVKMNVLAANSGGGSYSRSRDDWRNVVLFDTATGKSRRLLPDNNRRIIDMEFLSNIAPKEPLGPSGATVSGPTDQRRTVARYYYLLVEQPGDRGLQDLLIGDVAGNRRSYVLTGIDGIDWTTMSDPTHLDVLLRQGRKLFFRKIDMETFTVSAAIPVAID